METRLSDILTALIDDYITTAIPVGSQALVRMHKLDVSSATVRNCFAELESSGFLIQPHTSAGRIPTEKAYRWYADELRNTSISNNDLSPLSTLQFEDAEPISKLKRIAKACVKVTGVAALVGTNSSDTYYTGLSELFAQPEFQDWSKVVSMGSVLDDLDERISKLREQRYIEPTIMLGRECPFGNACAAMLLTLPENAILILLGPMRMNYRKAHGAMNLIQEYV